MSPFKHKSKQYSRRWNAASHLVLFCLHMWLIWVEYHFYSLEFAWRQWPDADRAYSIPKSVYGCPDQSKNQWIEGYMDFRDKLSEGAFLLEETLGPIRPEHNLFTIVGPSQSDGFRISFCSKKKRSGLREVNRDTEWPRGNYAIFHHNLGCPEGRRKVRHSIRKHVFCLSKTRVQMI